MIPVIALVGRPNVGKSTLFNCLTKSKDALVHDMPGVTRDRKYGHGQHSNKRFVVIDTGGITGDELGIDHEMAEQSKLAAMESDVVVFVVDAKDGLTALDEKLAEYYRALNKTIHVVVNKTDGMQPEVAVSEFYSLGFAEPRAIAAAHHRGVRQLIDDLLAPFPEQEESDPDDKRIKIAVVGRPNVGKSTLVNRILGEERVVVYDQPGTTRDSISIEMQREGVDYTIIDTAGVRRKGKVSEAVEKFSVIKTLQAIEMADVVITMIDATENITEQDLHLLSYTLNAGRALVIAVNKWDGLAVKQRDKIKSELSRRLQFLKFVNVKTISAKHGTGLGVLFGSIKAAYKSATRDLSTPVLTRILQDATEQHSPPLVNSRRIKLRYAHAGGKQPPTIIIHGNQTQHVPASYTRYLTNVFQTQLKLVGTPVRVEYKGGDNPYKDKKNKLTERQVRRKKRFKKIIQKKKKSDKN